LTYPIEWKGLDPLPIERLLSEQKQQDAPLPAVARAALSHWNRYLESGSESERDAFLESARMIWQVAAELPGGNAGWPLMIGRKSRGARTPRLSASMQGLAISILARVYALNGDENILRLAHAAARALQRDIFDGGLGAPIVQLGVLPQDVAVYPAEHGLVGVILAMLGLRDLATVDQSGETTAHDVITHAFQQALPAYDMGYGIRGTLTSWRAADAPSHRLGLVLLRGLAQATGERQYQTTAQRWATYRRPGPTLRRGLTSLRMDAGELAWRVAQRLTRQGVSGQPVFPPENALVVTHAFPVAGGTRAVIASLALVMRERWRLRYLTQHIGANPDQLEVTRFGNGTTTYWQFPNVWFYVKSAFGGVRQLLRMRPTRVILPQDSLYSGFAAALAGRLLHVRVVTMDHGTLTLIDSAVFRGERRTAMQRASFVKKLLSRARFALYWPSLRILARWTIRLADHHLIAGDEIEAQVRSYRNLPLGRLTRYPYMVDSDFFHPLSGTEREQRRAAAGLPVDAIVIGMNNRLAPEKGIEFAIEVFRRAYDMAPDSIRSRIRIVISGGGPMRGQIEEELRRAGLEKVCLLWGEATVPEVATILGISDIFVYAGLRGTNMSVAMLEAMAAGCAVIGSTMPISHARILAEGRGVPVAPGDVEAMTQALARLLAHPEEARAAGERARSFVCTYHSAEALRRALWRATGWEPEDQPAVSSN
jgi:glycosyltransferase involved in cell wall biosynthesis